MTMIFRRMIIWSLLISVVALALAYLLWPRPVPVDLATLSRGPLTVTVDEDGETRIRDIYEVSTPVIGRVLRIEREAGDTVIADQTIIAELQPVDPGFLDLRTEAELRATIEAAEAGRDLAKANVTRASAELVFAETDLVRIRRLAENHTVSERRLDEAELTLNTRKAELASAEATLDMRVHELERAKTRLISPAELINRRDDCACIPLQSPVDGKILRVLKESAGVLPAGTVLAEIGDPRDLEIIVDLLSADAVKVKAGQRVAISDWGGDMPLAGTVKRVEPYGFTKVSALGIEEQRVNVVIDLTDPPQAYARLAHGFRVEASIVLWESDDVLILPLTALFRRGDAWTVFAVENGRAAERAVEIGHANGLEVEVLSGLEVGDTVVVHPGNQVTDGIKVTNR